jgi:hypothetical protein
LTTEKKLRKHAKGLHKPPTTYNASQYEERMTKEFFSQFKSGLSNSDISSLHTTPDCDIPEARTGVTDVDSEIVDEFARYYTHLSRPKPSKNPDILIDALKTKGLKDEDSKKLESPLTLEEVKKAMLSMAKGKSPGPDGLGAEFYHAFSPMVAPRLHQMLREAQDDATPGRAAAGAPPWPHAVGQWYFM